jgi:hypothetical protein
MSIKTICAGIGALALIGGLAACGAAGSPAAAPTVRITQTVTAVPTPTVTKTVAPTPAVTSTVVPASVRTVYVAPSVPAYSPAVTNCGGGVYADADTSCPFALNVAANYTGAGADYAYSPVTGLAYTMYCNGGEGALDTVTCTGGDNALVDFTG